MKKLTSLILSAVLVLLSCVAPVSAYALDLIDISDAQITFPSESYVYSGEEITPEATVTISKTDPITLEPSEVTLVADTDYTVTYSENVNAGEATVTVEGMGEYTGTATKTFTIGALDFSDSVKIKNTSRMYVGTAGKYSVTYNDKELKKDVDYKLTVSNYSKTGIKSATVKVEGIGNYKGTKSIKDSVYPKKVSSISTKSRKTDTIELTWKAQKSDGVTGYQVYTCDEKGKNAKLYATVSSNSCKVTKRKAGAYYYFIVRSYKKSDTQTIKSDASAVYKTCAKPATVSLRSVTKSKDKKKLTIKWKKVGCTAYEVEYSTDKSFKKGVNKVTVKGESHTSATVNIKKNDKTYYARVRAYRRYNKNKTTVYGARSSTLSSSFSKLYASYTTSYVNNPNRTTNLKLACKAIDGKVVYPGETFSFNGTVGQRTAAKGYKEAYVFTGPNSHTLGLGGGVCQVASTMFNAALMANFQIVERHQHSQRVSYCPLGRDAAIYWGSENFRFKNNTKYPIKIKMRCGGGTLTCSYYVCYDVSPKKVKLSVSRSGNHFTLKRTVGGKVNYTAYSTY